MDEAKVIVAIGASSGGIEALSKFFDYTIPAGVSYVVITHLFPDYKSQLGNIIQNRSRLKVYTVKNNMNIESNTVYVMPENMTMKIKDGYLILSPRDLSIKLNKAIDIFFTSLAEDRLYVKIAIILSGMGEDGTEGVKAISRNGGYIFAQSISSARHSSMPNSVINSGLVDETMLPEEMPSAIIAYILNKRNN